MTTGRMTTGGKGRGAGRGDGRWEMVKERLGEMKGKGALVVGRYNSDGEPMAARLLGEHCTVTIAQSRARDVGERCGEADILIAAVGVPEMVPGDWIKPGATVIDVGINRIEAPEKGLNDDGTPKTKLVGDVNFEDAKKVAAHITPVPGGVGPMTIANLLRNTVIAACRQNSLAAPEI